MNVDSINCCLRFLDIMCIDEIDCFYNYTNKDQVV